MRIYALILSAVLFVGCKTAQPTVAETKTPAAPEDAEVAKVISGHYADAKNFRTLAIKASAKYKDENQSQSINAEIRIEKDKQIFVSIRFLGITMAKALITPNEVKYYEKINSTYFEGDYEALSRWLGTSLDYNKVQNLLIGRVLDDLNKGKYKSSVEGNLVKLTDNSDTRTLKSFYFEPENYLIKKEQVSQPAQQRSLEVNYPGFNKFEQAYLPAKILLEAIQPKGKTNISIEYNAATFNENLQFPYSVPEGFERVNLD
ncbi:DUF4292 domain-containing protein [Flavobacterium sp. MAH-1]|uniref:DUF4292 domain-containing protein n=1 Tax=Flavobacterium agri TaxID=2743471 RepID=A0A7Y9C4H8_9FLAO|nr:DUF4292 domain-containing protein [Flavobacterium agri]NUY80176.1 DUF4292 domain-containing protein [Flavobacterium agri]NYA70201.1 DUF4292 domain-containing protein [Flavobacterium agri]